MAEDDALLRINQATAEAERRFPFIKQFRNKVNIAPTKVRNKRGLGEFVEAHSPDNPMPGKPTITIGRNSHKLQGGAADTIIADMVHAASEFSPSFKKLKREMISKLGESELALARRKFEKDRKIHTGSNFDNFENYLNRYYADGLVQHLLLPEKSEIADIKRHSPDAVPALNAIKHLFETGAVAGSVNNIGKILNE